MKNEQLISALRQLRHHLRVTVQAKVENNQTEIAKNLDIAREYVETIQFLMADSGVADELKLAALPALKMPWAIGFTWRQHQLIKRLTKILTPYLAK